MASRCRTPKRCCSSTTATRRSRKRTPSWISAWVPTTTSASPVARASQDGPALGRRLAALQQPHLDALGAAAAPKARGSAGRPGPRWAPSGRPVRPAPPPAADSRPPPWSCPTPRPRGAGGAWARRRTRSVSISPMTRRWAAVGAYGSPARNASARPAGGPAARASPRSILGQPRGAGRPAAEEAAPRRPVVRARARLPSGSPGSGCESTASALPG